MSATTPAKKPRKDTQETHRQIIDAAEALFAEHGIDNVTLLDISRAAGQKNRFAPQYHFGDKASLINAVLNKHSDLISLRRKEMMEVLAHKNSPTLRELVEAYVLPVAEHIDSTENSRAYLLINSQLMTSKAYTEVTTARAKQYPEVQQLMRLINKHMVAENRAQREYKKQLIQSLVFHGLASYFISSDNRSSELFIDTLCSSVEAVLKSDS